MADYSEAIRLKPDFAMAYYKRGLLKQKNGDAANAASDFRKARDLGYGEKNQKGPPANQDQ